MANFEISIERTIKAEGGKDKYTNHPSDKGGPTRHGITEKLARAHGYIGDMKDFPWEWALRIYRSDFWDTLRLDDVIDQLIADQLLQAAVNQGADRWHKYLQKVCNQFLKITEKLVVDGIVGNKTISSLTMIIRSGRRIPLSKGIYDRQEARYDAIVEHNPKQQENRNGWHNRSKEFLITA